MAKQHYQRDTWAEEELAVAHTTTSPLPPHSPGAALLANGVGAVTTTTPHQNGSYHLQQQQPQQQQQQHHNHHHHHHHHTSHNSTHHHSALKHRRGGVSGLARRHLFGASASHRRHNLLPLLIYVASIVKCVALFYFTSIHGLLYPSLYSRNLVQLFTSVAAPIMCSLSASWLIGHVLRHPRCCPVLASCVAHYNYFEMPCAVFCSLLAGICATIEIHCYLPTAALMDGSSLLLVDAGELSASNMTTSLNGTSTIVGGASSDRPLILWSYHWTVPAGLATGLCLLHALQAFCLQ